MRGYYGHPPAGKTARCRLEPGGRSGNETIPRFFPCPLPFPPMPTAYLFTRRVLGVLAALFLLTRAMGAEIVEVKKIWDAGGHNAFTDLVHWQGRWWCTFRESEAHVGGDGIIRIIVSSDGKKWESAATLTEKDVDLRDPKLSEMPDGRLMLVCGGSIYLGTKQLKGRRPRVSFSSDGKTWTTPQKILSEGDWLWRVTWQDKVAYGVSYRSKELLLFKSADGMAWTEVSKLAVPDYPNETTVRFAADGRMIAMVRREQGNTLGWWGEARPPYTEWSWKESNLRFGGPDFLTLPDGRTIAGTRRYPTAGTKEKVSFILGEVKGAAIEPLLTLPSGGDTSYPRLVWHEGLLWVSYYSSHEGKTAIYLAKVKL